MLNLPGVSFAGVSARILTAGTPQAHNTFDRPDAVRARDFTALQPAPAGWELILPPHSVAALTFA
jgi:hypothetical protein